MNAQDLLTYALDVLVLGFIAIATIDFTTGLVQLWQTETVLPSQVSLFDAQPQMELQPTEEVQPAIELATSFLDVVSPEPAPTMKEPPAQPQRSQPYTAPEAAPPSLEEILQNVDLETLPIRPARKIARALGIAQKVNGKDQPLSWLRAQIKAKLQQPQEVPPAAIEAVLDLLAS